MEWYATIGVMVGSIAAMMLLGFPVAFAFLGVNIFGAIAFMGGIDGLSLVVANATNRLTIFILVPIPLFMLMGELFFRTGLAMRVFDAFDLVLGRLPGRLAFLTVGGGTFFSALTGSSIAVLAKSGRGATSLTSRSRDASANLRSGVLKVLADWVGGVQSRMNSSASSSTRISPSSIL